MNETREKQTTIFSDYPSQDAMTYQKKKEGVQWQLYTDGASRNNPGKAGAGILLLKQGKVVEQQGFFLGIKTNNQAEYLAFLVGLFFVKKRIQPLDRIIIFADSQLLVRQLNGTYRVKNDLLKPLYSIAYSWLSDLRHEVVHIFRSENEKADDLANKGIDKETQLPYEFILMMRSYGILL